MAGADAMLGGAGNNVYFVDWAGDVSGSRMPTRATTRCFRPPTSRLSDDVENLVLLGSADLQGYGNSEANTLYGNGGTNLLNGNGGRRCHARRCRQRRVLRRRGGRRQ